MSGHNVEIAATFDVLADLRAIEGANRFRVPGYPKIMPGLPAKTFPSGPTSART